MSPSSSLNLRSGPAPRPPLWPGGKPKVYLATGVFCVVAGLLVTVLGLVAPSRGPTSVRRQGTATGVVLALVGGALVALTWSARKRQPLARVALTAWARKHAFDRPSPDVARGKWKGESISLRIAYGAVHTRGDARGWLAEVGEGDAKRWVVVLEPFEDEVATRSRIGLLCDAVVASARSSRA